jgi:TRAP-type C4-dicarboxylate transport system permease small subunit
MLLKIWRSLLVAAMAAITLVVLLGVAARYIFGAPLLWTDEAARIVLIFLMFLGIAELFRLRQGHVAIDTLANFLGGRPAKAIRVLAAIVVVASLAVMIFGGAILSDPARPATTAVLGIPMWVLYSVIPASGVLGIVFLVVRLFDRSSREPGKE